MVQRIDEFQRRRPAVGFPVALIYKFADDQGPFLAALITYYGFLSLFPLLLLATSILGLILESDPGLRHRILDSTLSQFPVIGEQLGEPKGLQGNPAAIIVGGVVAVYGAIGVAQAFQNASNIAWSIPRNRRPNPLKARVRSLGLLTMGGIAVLITTVLSALAGSATQFGAHLGPVVPVVLFLLAVAINSSAFLLAFNMCTVATSSLRKLAPGALTAAVVWQLLQVFGTAYVGHVVKGAGPTYGAFALVLGLLAWLYLANLGVVFGIEINVVLAKNLYPRALLTPFTDDVDLTPGDVVAYTHAAQAQQTKGFENVTVTFQDEGQHATARRRRRWPWHWHHRGESGRGSERHARGTSPAMNDPSLPPTDDQSLADDDDTLPPEHPAGSDAPGSAGEVLSGEGLGASGAAQSNAPHTEPTRDRAPGDDS